MGIMVGIYNMNLSSDSCNKECAWRNAFYIPATALLVAAALVYYLGDDSPKGEFVPKEGGATKSAADVATNCEGIVLIIFSRMNNFGAAIFFMICFSLFVQSAEGTTFAIVPYVDPPNTGAVCGFVGAGGNIGAVCWGFLFLGVGNYSLGFMILGFIVLGIGTLGFAINVEDKPRDTVADDSIDGKEDAKTST